jgi:hypothetical protein
MSKFSKALRAMWAEYFVSAMLKSATILHTKPRKKNSVNILVLISDKGVTLHSSTDSCLPAIRSTQKDNEMETKILKWMVSQVLLKGLCTMNGFWDRHRAVFLRRSGIQDNSHLLRDLIISLHVKRIPILDRIMWQIKPVFRFPQHFLKFIIFITLTSTSCFQFPL